MGTDHGVQHLTHGEGILAMSDMLLRQVVGYREDRAQVIRGMAPLGCQPGVVVIQPAHTAADIPCGFDRVETEIRSRHAGPVRYHGPFDNRSQVFGALGKAQCQQATTESVHQAIARGVECLIRGNAVIQHVIGNILNHPVIIRAQIAGYSVNLGHEPLSLALVPWDGSAGTLDNSKPPTTNSSINASIE